MKLKQYRPAFFEGFKNEDADVCGWDDIMKVPFVANFGADDPSFIGFTLKNYGKGMIPDPTMILKAHYGNRHLVVAFLTGTLPEILLPAKL